MSWKKAVSNKVQRLASDLGGDLTYKGEKVELPRGSNKQQVFLELLSFYIHNVVDLITGTVTALNTRLSFASDPTLSACSNLAIRFICTG